MVYNMKRVILLSELAVRQKPSHLFLMAKMLRPDLIPSFFEYGYRYCDPRQGFEGIDFGYCGNLTELK